ncbi:hypothetical protein [Streptomyces sp. NBC_00887]|uniref:hypothetical protein n=1 Tax=Streptomyces sp. NBC_00887 TaxID=2975859 RepID=UPI003868B994|nr:hypothetical protein OG844_01465 [Streptomyces sp. NBC_00887]WSY36173.1 hypothetical protein OG844_44135 [Streptomyces sp. NBC_00887]
MRGTESRRAMLFQPRTRTSIVTLTRGDRMWIMRLPGLRSRWQLVPKSTGMERRAAAAATAAVEQA